MSIQSLRPEGSGPGPVAIEVHHRASWVERGLYYDVMGLTALLLSGIALGFDLYRAGYVRALAGASAGASFDPLLRLALELAVFTASFAWVSARLVAAAYREMPRLG